MSRSVDRNASRNALRNHEAMESRWVLREKRQVSKWTSFQLADVKNI